MGFIKDHIDLINYVNGKNRERSKTHNRIKLAFFISIILVIICLSLFVIININAIRQASEILSKAESYEAKISYFCCDKAKFYVDNYDDLSYSYFNEKITEYDKVIKTYIDKLNQLSRKTTNNGIVDKIIQYKISQLITTAQKTIDKTNKTIDNFIKMKEGNYDSSNDLIDSSVEILGN